MILKWKTSSFATVPVVDIEAESDDSARALSSTQRTSQI